MDESIGRILNALKEFQLEKDTIVVFTSDNGPEVMLKFCYLEITMIIYCILVYK